MTPYQHEKTKNAIEDSENAVLNKTSGNVLPSPESAQSSSNVPKTYEQAKAEYDALEAFIHQIVDSLAAVGLKEAIALQGASPFKIIEEFRNLGQFIDNHIVEGQTETLAELQKKLDELIRRQ